MANKDEIKRIVATFLRTEPEKINTSTKLDHKAVPGSVLYQRMCAELKMFGLRQEDFTSIHNFGDLMSMIDGGSVSPPSPKLVRKSASESITSAAGIGIDFEQTGQFQMVNDYWTDDFYTSVFNDEEIAYCSVAKNPSQSFTGLFAAKEAIIKANPDYGSRSLRDIAITHSKSGVPIFQDFFISITHVEEYAAAVALWQDTEVLSKSQPSDFFASHTQDTASSPNSTLTSPPHKTLFTVLPLALSLIALVAAFFALWR